MNVVADTPLRTFLRLASGFWRGHNAAFAWGMSATVLVLALVDLAAQVGLNRWNGWFFDALEKKQTSVLLPAVLVFLGLALTSVATVVAAIACRILLQVRWRAWLTKRVLDLWLAEQVFEHNAAALRQGEDPEYRIADEVRMATEPIADFANGLFTAALMSATFLGILWELGGSVVLPGSPIEIPGYMVFAALAYAGASAAAMFLVGRPHVARIRDRNEAEARFRYELTLLREEADEIDTRRERAERREEIYHTFARVVRAWMRVAFQTSHMTWVSYGNVVLAPVVPLFLIAPKYFSGDISLGTMMQVAMAFVQVQGALSWFVANYARIAEWYASVTRVMALVEELRRREPDASG